jgi:hypothetical protein
MRVRKALALYVFLDSAPSAKLNGIDLEAYLQNLRFAKRYKAIPSMNQIPIIAAEDMRTGRRNVPLPKRAAITTTTKSHTSIAPRSGKFLSL